MLKQVSVLISICLMCTAALILSPVPVMGGESQSLYGYLEISTTGADTSNGLWLRTYIAMPPNNARPKELQEVAFDFGPDPYFGDIDSDTKYWLLEAGNFPTSQSMGDSVMVLIDWEEDPGLKTHKGYFAVINDTIWDPEAHTFYPLNDCTLRVMPAPDTVERGKANLVWYKPVQDSGNPKTDNIIGYNLYCSRLSVVGSSDLGRVFPDQLNTSVITDTTYEDLTITPGDTSYYAYKIVYRPDTTTTDASDGYESLYLSPNSPPVWNPPLAVFISAYSGYSMNGQVFIEWRTESEEGNYAWQIDRSLSAHSGFETVYYEIDDEPTAPNATEYCFVDTEVKVGERYYYKLADIDNKGQVTWRGTIAVDVVAGDAFIEPQCMPNPFQEITSIKYVITHPGRVTLKIVDLSGRVVATLQDGSQKAGIHTALWNGKDSKGNDAPGGIYFFRLNTPSGESTGKLVLFQ